MGYKTFEFQGTIITIDMDYRMEGDTYAFHAQRNGAAAPADISIRFCPKQGCLDNLTDVFDVPALPSEMEYLLQQEGQRLEEELRREIFWRRDPDY